MDFKFFTNDQLQLEAKFSMGHEAIGRWLTEELGKNRDAIETLLQTIAKIEKNEIQDESIEGKDFVLRLHKDEVEIIALTFIGDACSDFDDQDDIPEDTNLYNEEMRSECGLPDFKYAVESWLVFIAQQTSTPARS